MFNKHACLAKEQVGHIRGPVAGVPHSTTRCQAAGRCCCTARGACSAATSCSKFRVTGFCAAPGGPRWLFTCYDVVPQLAALHLLSACFKCLSACLPACLHPSCDCLSACPWSCKLLANVSIIASNAPLLYILQYGDSDRPLFPAASADQQTAPPMQETSRTSSTGRGERGDSVFIREYSNNKLLREDAISAEELDAVFGPFQRRQERRQKRRIRTKRVRG